MKSTKEMQTSNAEMVTISRAEYEEFQAQRKKISELESRVDLLMEALRLARHKQFGASSEKSEDTLMEQLSFLFNEAEVFSAAQKEEENVTVVAAHKQIYTAFKLRDFLPLSLKLLVFRAGNGHHFGVTCLKIIYLFHVLIIPYMCQKVQ